MLLALAPAGAADAAKKRKAPGFPTIAKITLMQFKVGDVVTISGKNVLRGKARNTVVLRRDGKRALYDGGLLGVHPLPDHPLPRP